MVLLDFLKKAWTIVHRFSEKNHGLYVHGFDKTWTIVHGILIDFLKKAWTIVHGFDRFF